MNITIEQLNTIMPLAKARTPLYLDFLNAAMTEFDINTTARQAAFLAEIAHESGELRYTRELARGAAYDVGQKAISLGNTPEDDGDGEKYKGRGLIQITGHANYLKTGVALGVDLIASPELLETPALACRSAACWWRDHGLNELADGRRFAKISLIINGGHNGDDSRNAYYKKAIQALGLYSS